MAAATASRLIHRLYRVAVLVVAASALAACQPAADKPGAGSAGFNGIDITGASYAQKFELPDADGRVRTLADFRGKVTVVFFGFTQCPDVCPTAMSEIAQARQSLGADGARVQPVFVTIDPERDTPEVIKAYVASFGDDVVALRGTAEQTQATAREFKVFYAKAPGRAEGSYTMDHTAGLYVLDANGRIRLFVRHGAGAPALAADLKHLLAEAAG